MPPRKTPFSPLSQPTRPYFEVLPDPSPLPVGLSTAVKTVSTVHSSLLTALAIYVLNQDQWRSAPPTPA